MNLFVRLRLWVYYAEQYRNASVRVRWAEAEANLALLKLAQARSEQARYSRLLDTV